MKYYLVAGEASGDLHGSNLMKGLKIHDSNAEFRFFGGDLMAAVGGTLAKHYRDMAFMGFLEVVKNLRTISHNFKDCQNDIEQYQPDVTLLDVRMPRGRWLRNADEAAAEGAQLQGGHAQLRR